jgi:hypothetical protein
MFNLETSEIGFQFRFGNRFQFGIAIREFAESRRQLCLCLCGLLLYDDISEIIYDMLDSDDSIALSSTSLKYIWNLKDCALHISPKYSLAFADSLIQPIYRKFAHLTIAMTTKRSLIKLPESVLSLNLSGEINGLQISGSNLQSLTMTDAFPRSLTCSRLEAVHFSNDKVSSYIDIYLRKTRTLGSSLIYISQQLIRGRSEWITESAQLGRDRCCFPLAKM